MARLERKQPKKQLRSGAQQAGAPKPAKSAAKKTTTAKKTTRKTGKS